MKDGIFIFNDQTIGKKGSFLFVLIILLIGLSACGSSGSSANATDDLDNWQNNIGKTSDDVFDNLDLEEGKDIEADSHIPFYYFYKKEEADFHGESFQKRLAFNPDNDKLHQFGYWKQFDNTEDGYELVNKLYDDYNEDLTATDDMSESGLLENLPDDVDELDDFAGEYNEVWNYNDELHLKLTFLRDPEGASMVKIEYFLKPEAIPDDW